MFSILKIQKVLKKYVWKFLKVSQKIFEKYA